MVAKVTMVAMYQIMVDHMHRCYPLLSTLERERELRNGLIKSHYHMCRNHCDSILTTTIVTPETLAGKEFHNLLLDTSTLMCYKSPEGQSCLKYEAEYMTGEIPCTHTITLTLTLTRHSL